MAVIAVDAGINIRPATSSRLTQSKTAAGKQGDNLPHRSRDAKSCVSRGKKCIYHHRIITHVYGDGEDGRRKILRLYKADAVGMEGWDMGDDK